MASNFSKIKLYGPGIPNGLSKLKEISDNDQLDFDIVSALPCIGEEADYELKWGGIPTAEDTLELVRYLDRALSSCKCRYTITTTSPIDENLLSMLKSEETPQIAFTFVRLIGPSISAAIAAMKENIEEFHGVKDMVGELLGAYDFALEWLRIPNVYDIVQLLKEMDKFIEPTGARYQITTKSRLAIYVIPPERKDIRPERILRLF